MYRVDKLQPRQFAFSFVNTSLGTRIVLRTLGGSSVVECGQSSFPIHGMSDFVCFSFLLGCDLVIGTSLTDC